MLVFGMPMWAFTEALSTMDAGFAKTGSSAWMRKYGPLKLSERERSNPVSSHCSIGRKSAAPAFEADAGRAASDQSAFIFEPDHIRI